MVGLADVYERLVSRPVDGHARTHSEVVQMICTGVCGAFNPLLLDCLQDMEAEIARAMRTRRKKPENITLPGFFVCIKTEVRVLARRHRLC